MRYIRIYADAQGESHSEEVEVDLTEGNYSPPAPALWASAIFPVIGYRVMSFPRGWYGDWHPAPERQILFFLKGDGERETSDGHRERSGPGDIVLVEDTWGKGHRSWVVGDDDRLAAVVVLPD